MTTNNSRSNPAELDAEHYVKNSSLQNSLAKEIIDAQEIDSNFYILDVGCGDGRITAEIAQRAKLGKVLGIDASHEMIKFALKSFPNENFPNLSFLQITAEEIEFQQRFDLIVSFSCFHWLKDPGLVIHQLSSALKTRGELLILTYPKESPYYRYLQIALESFPEYYPHSANHTMLSAEGYEQLLIKNSFNILLFEKRNLTVTYNSLEEIQEFIRGWLENYVPLPKTLHDSFLQKVGRAILEDPATSKNGKITIPYTALIIRAIKVSELY